MIISDDQCYCSCGVVNASCISRSKKVAGWLHNKRDHGQLVFFEVRDRSGILQCVCEESDLVSAITDISCESVICVTGVVQERLNQPGKIELQVNGIEVMSAADQVPFAINKDSPLSDDLKNRYRFLYLRRARMLRNLELRYNVTRFVRNFMHEKGFLEVQTPILTCPSPEGARDFLVPSRKHLGKFYALPQAPQIFKQLMIASGIDKYFQIAPCFRDEDSRADRLAGEFYQIDLEMAFVEEQDVIGLTLDLLLQLFQKFKPDDYKLDTHVKYIAYRNAMKIYGTDKPDLRNPLAIQRLDVFKSNVPKIFAKSISNDGAVVGMVIPDRSLVTNKVLNEYKDLVVIHGAPVLVFIGRDDDGLVGSIVDTFSPCQKKCLENMTSPGEGMFILSVYPAVDASKIMGILRQKVWEVIKTPEEAKQFKFVCITDMPMFEYDEDGVLAPAHNPFSMPNIQSEGDLSKMSPEDIKSKGYDIVCNGFELGSGSIRNHISSLLFKVLSMLGYSRERAGFEFGALIDAFGYGIPPHGGIALGLERLLMLLADEKNVREVCAMPLTQAGEDKLLKAPRAVSQPQLEELGIKHKYDFSTASSEKGTDDIRGFFEEGGKQCALDSDKNFNSEKNHPDILDSF